MTGTFSYKTEFPDFELDVSIPEGFDDQSDAGAGDCPQWEDSSRNMVLVIDYADPEKSSGSQARFALMEDDRCGGDAGYFSNNYQDVMAVLNKEARAFESFISTRRKVGDLRDIDGYGFEEPAHGYVYLNAYWIEEVGSAYYTVIGNQEYEKTSLAEMERLLWNFFVRSEVFQWTLPTDYLTDDIITGLNEAADRILRQFGTTNDRSYDEKAIELRDQGKKEAAEIMDHLSAIWEILSDAD